jgi:hypothetical protein
MKLSKIFSWAYTAAMVLLLIYATGCTKNSSGSGQDYLRFTVDGRKAEAYSTPAVSLNAIPGIHDLGVSGFKDNLYNDTYLIISMSALAPIDRPSSFNSTQLLNSGSITHYPALHIFYYDASGEEFTSLYGDNSWTNIPGLSSTATDAVLTITEISSNRVKGTFSCTVYSQTNPSKKYKITNGEFNVPKY